MVLVLTLSSYYKATRSTSGQQKSLVSESNQSDPLYSSQMRLHDHVELIFADPVWPYSTPACALLTKKWPCKPKS